MIGIREVFEYTLSSLDFSTLSTFPRRGSIAWKRLSRHPFAEPPAESPSTRYTSVSLASLSLQSASLPGSVDTSSTFLRLVSSRAFLAASLALFAAIAFSMIIFAEEGFSSRNSASFCDIILSTSRRISLLPSFAFVWLSNCASVSFTEIIATRPSLTSSPERPLSSPLITPVFLA